MKCLKLLFVFVCLTVLFISNCSDVTFDNVLDANGTNPAKEELRKPYGEEGLACMYDPDCPDYVKDTEPPIITLLGDNPAKIPYGDPNNLLTKLKEQVKVYDEYEKKDYTKEISPTTDVAIFEPGEYKIVYEASDKAGNKATEKRVVIVEDEDISIVNTPPSIFIIGDVIDDKITIAEGEGFDIEDYYGASDREDKDLDASDLKIDGTYKTDKAGEYKLKVYVKDSEGLKTDKPFTLIVEKEVVGNKPPVLTLKGDTLIEGLNSLKEFKEPGYTVDDPDGNKDKITVELDTIDNGNIIYITYQAFDEFEAKSAKLKRTLKINTGDPIITVKLANGQLVSSNEITILTRSEFKTVITATDTDGKEISSSKIQIKDNVTTTKAGTYTLEITAIDDNERDAVRTITVHVKDQDKKPPVITIEDDRFKDEDKKEIIRYSDDTEEFEVPKATAFDNEEDRDLTDSIKVNGADKVKLDEEGTYKISYTVSDTSGNTASDTVKVIIKLPTSKFLDKYGVTDEYKLTQLQGMYTFSEMDGDEAPKLTPGLKTFSISMGSNGGNVEIYDIRINYDENVGTNGTDDDLKDKIEHNFGTEEESAKFTITGAKVKNLDNTYYLVVDDDELYWVQEDGDFVIIWKAQGQ